MEIIPAVIVIALIYLVFSCPDRTAAQMGETLLGNIKKDWGKIREMKILSYMICVALFACFCIVISFTISTAIVGLILFSRGVETVTIPIQPLQITFFAIGVLMMIVVNLLSGIELVKKNDSPTEEKEEEAQP